MVLSTPGTIGPVVAGDSSAHPADMHTTAGPSRFVRIALLLVLAFITAVVAYYIAAYSGL